MSSPLTSNQHGYVKRALHAFETVAEALERIAPRSKPSPEPAASPTPKSGAVDAPAVTHDTVRGYQADGVAGVSD